MQRLLNLRAQELLENPSSFVLGSLMSSVDRLALAYARFINFSASVRQLTGPSALDAAEERMLHCLAAAWSMDHPLTVLQAMALPHGLSQSTAHRRLTQLRKKGFMNLKTDEHDARVRYVESTDKAQRYFSQLGRCMVEALKESGASTRGA
jgi:DNA-binding MarR family transcriptional regulator